MYPLCWFCGGTWSQRPSRETVKLSMKVRRIKVKKEVTTLDIMLFVQVTSVEFV